MPKFKITKTRAQFSGCQQVICYNQPAPQGALTRTFKMETQIFNSYQDFLNREDKTVNGVSIEFSIIHLNFAEQNKTIEGC